MKYDFTSIGARGNFRASMMRFLSITVIAIGVLLLPVLVAGPDIGFGAVWAGNGSGYGGGSGGGGGSGSGGGNNGGGVGGSNGNGGSGPDKGSLYGDMVYLVRDDYGVPVLDSEDCLQPMGLDPATGELEALPLYWKLGDDPDMEQVPDFCEDSDDAALTSSSTEAVIYAKPPDVGDPDAPLGPCDVIAICANNVHEVELGRLSVMRAPERVLDRQRDEALRNILKGDEVTLDPSGRLTVDGSTMDSPLINLAFYRDFQVHGALMDGDVVVFEPPYGFGASYDFYLAAAFGLAAGDDKVGADIDPEVVTRANAILGIPGREFHQFAPTHELTVPDPEGGPAQEMKFLNYFHFSYDRADVFPGCIMYDYFLDPDGDGVGEWILDYQTTIIDAVFGEDDVVDPGPVDDIAGFAMAANDARRVLAFVHDLGEDALRGRVDPVFQNSGAYCP